MKGNSLQLLVLFFSWVGMTPLTYGINHAGLSCEGLLCRRVVEHVEGDNTIPS